MATGAPFKIDKNTSVSLGLAITLFGAVWARDRWISDKILKFESTVKRAFSLEEMQIWTDTVRDINREKYPDFKFPNPLDIRGKRKLREVNEEIEKLIHEREALVKNKANQTVLKKETLVW